MYFIKQCLIYLIDNEEGEQRNSWETLGVFTLSFQILQQETLKTAFPGTENDARTKSRVKKEIPEEGRCSCGQSRGAAPPPGRCFPWGWQGHLPHPLAKPSIPQQRAQSSPLYTQIPLGGVRGYFLLTSPQICNPAVKLCQSQLIRQRFPLPSPAWLLPPNHVASANVQPHSGFRETTLLQELEVWDSLPRLPAAVPPRLRTLLAPSAC